MPKDKVGEGKPKRKQPGGPGGGGAGPAAGPAVTAARVTQAVAAHYIIAAALR